jgi:cbb3-type cytochrome oxidase subunit 1
MKGVALWFFAAGVLAVTGGMLWGIQMAASGDHLMAPAHAHLNLVGWVTMAMFGVYYHLHPRAAGRGLARVHFVVALAGLVILVPGIALAVSEAGETLAKVGSVLTLASMLIFLATVAIEARRQVG